MIYLLWASPFLLVALLLATGRVSSAAAGLCAALAAAAVALAAAPLPTGPGSILLAAAKGLWLAALVGAVILAGLFFRHVAATAGGSAVTATDAGQVAADPARRRAHAFAACFLVGPFAEAATGFGVGQVAAVAMLAGLGLSPLHVALLALFSQVLVPWGAMANGTVVGAEFARMVVAELGFRSAILTAPLLLAWLVLFWRFAALAGLPVGGRGALAREAGWVLAVAVMLPLANRAVGAEVAALAVLGPLIALRFWWEERPDRARWRAAIRLALPYAVLIAGLAATRGLAGLHDLLARAGDVRPFADGPALAPLLHPASWLLGVGLGAALLGGRGAAGGGGLAIALAGLRVAWRQGRRAVLTIAAFLVVARVLADAGIADALADGLHAGLGRWAVAATPALAGAFGLLTGSGNASNGLLMGSRHRTEAGITLSGTEREHQAASGNV
jgi:lactate permease